MDLNQLNDKLRDHFISLHDRKQKQFNHARVFALEHGLDKDEIQDLFSAVRKQIKEGSPQQEHALAWIVYATEMGYRYAGNEYWQTFERVTPGWTTFNDRNFIKIAFMTFSAEFHGIELKGAWAKHFSIISWPITNAIIPADLQLQLLRVLAEKRGAFTEDLFNTPEKLGELIYNSSWRASPRFQNLAEETALMGSIAKALIFQEEDDVNSIIEVKTFKRLCNDLRSKQQTRVLFQNVRDTGRDLVAMRTRGSLADNQPKPSTASRIHETLSRLNIEPKVVLICVDSSQDSWDVMLKIDNLAPLLDINQAFQHVLTTSRCRVQGVRSPLAPGHFLFASPPIRLMSWPGENDVLIQFENSIPVLDALFKTNCFIGASSTRLFQIRADGRAYELFNQRVKPNNQYIITKTSEPYNEHKLFKPINLTCTGIYGALLDMPASISSEWEEALRVNGLGVARTVEVWPAGIDAYAWDDEGSIVWLESEHPCLGFRADHRLYSLSVRISGSFEDSLSITAIEPNEAVFVQLPALPIGKHQISVSAKSDLSRGAFPLTEYIKTIEILNESSHRFNRNPISPVIHRITPLNPNVEQLWEGNVDLTILGPIGRNIKCTAALFDSDIEIASYQLGRLDFPVTPSSWRTHFHKFIKGNSGIGKRYDQAKRIRLDFSTDELGTFEIMFEREFTPLRWLIKHHDHNDFASFIDDTGTGEELKFSYYKFSRPCEKNQLENTDEFLVDDKGGLYVAIKGDTVASVVIPPIPRSFDDFECEPVIRDDKRKPDVILELLRSCTMWGHAKLSGNFLSLTNQRIVLKAITKHITGLVGGEKWFKVEHKFEADGTLQILDEAISNDRHVVEECRKAIVEQMQKGIDTIDVWLRGIISLENKYDILRLKKPKNTADAEWLSEFALRLASDTVNIEAWAGGRLKEGLSSLIEFPEILRIARFFVLSTSSHYEDDESHQELYPGWKWQ